MQAVDEVDKASGLWTRDEIELRREYFQGHRKQEEMCPFASQIGQRRASWYLAGSPNRQLSTCLASTAATSNLSAGGRDTISLHATPLTADMSFCDHRTKSDFRQVNSSDVKLVSRRKGHIFST